MLTNISHIGLMTNKEILKSISQRVVSERKVRDMTQKELSNHSGVNISTLRLFERTGQTSFENLIQISRTLGRIDIFNDFYDFKMEYQKLGYNEYYDIKKKSERKMVRSKE